MRFFSKLFLLFVVAGCCFPNLSWSGACLGDSLRYRFFPEEVGQFNGISRVTVQLPCDTMIVEAGKMSTIYPHTLLHFGSRVAEHCVIQVRGQLYAKAGRTSKIIFSGDVDSSEFGVVSGAGIWGGLLIDTLGSVYFQNVEVKNASTAMIFIGRNSRMEKVGFIGAFGLILPGGRNYSLNPKGTFFTSFDILAPPKKTEPPKPSISITADTPKANTKSRPGLASSDSNGISSWVWPSVAAGALIAGGAAAYVYWPGEEQTVPNTEEPPQPDAFEGEPLVPTAQKR